MTEAQRVAGMRALAQLDAQGYAPDRIVLDGNHNYLGLGARVTTVVKGDTKCLAVAAASCVAKVARDHLDDGGSRALPAVRLRVERGLSRRPRTRPRWRATARARSTADRGSSWKGSAGGASTSTRPAVRVALSVASEED